LDCAAGKTAIAGNTEVAAKLKPKGFQVNEQGSKIHTLGYGVFHMYVKIFTHAY
jgi:hypothetical protein